MAQTSRDKKMTCFIPIPHNTTWVKKEYEYFSIVQLQSDFCFLVKGSAITKGNRIMRSMGESLGKTVDEAFSLFVGGLGWKLFSLVTGSLYDV